MLFHLLHKSIPIHVYVSNRRLAVFQKLSRYFHKMFLRKLAFSHNERTSMARSKAPAHPPIDSDNSSASADASEQLDDPMTLPQNVVHRIYPGATDEEISDLRKKCHGITRVYVMPDWLPAAESCCAPFLEVVKEQPARDAETGHVGRGMMAVQEVKEGTFLGVYCGQLLSEEEYLASNTSMVFVTLYFIYIESPFWNKVRVDSTELSYASGVHLINHSDDYNCVCSEGVLCGLPVLGVYANKRIEKDEFLRIDYQEDYWKDSEVKKVEVAHFRALEMTDKRYISNLKRMYPSLRQPQRAGIKKKK
ncbi:SET domain [Carpediemonas membranifera]|uniref:SET domain n=1 Tax=Carpediemonas membranifera TaxID=201153 RepID=A0A8J6AQD4_9EUKA|nr:SET domain [Carpediemonas membranifera]|eukprot:KAG9391291.1 SET domain [Carpediemonas membranifera]